MVNMPLRTTAWQGVRQEVLLELWTGLEAENPQPHPMFCCKSTTVLRRRSVEVLLWFILNHVISSSCVTLQYVFKLI
jgi:hypothetical protein